MAKTDSRTKIRPDLIKTPLHHLVVIKKKIGMTAKRPTEIKRLWRLHTAGENTGNSGENTGNSIFSSYLERLIFDYSSSD